MQIDNNLFKKALVQLERYVRERDYSGYDPYEKTRYKYKKYINGLVRKRGGAMMTSEAGVLGVPWIFVSNKTRGYLEDQEKNHGLGYIISDPEQTIGKAVELLENDNFKGKWQKKKRRLLNEKIDVTRFMTWFIYKTIESLYGWKRWI